MKDANATQSDKTFRVQMLGSGTVAYEFDTISEQKAVARACKLADSFRTPAVASKDIVRFEGDTITIRVFHVNPDANADEGPASYDGILRGLVEEIGRLSPIREQTGLGDMHLFPTANPDAPVLEVGRYAVLYNRSAPETGIMQKGVVRLFSVSPSRKTVIIDLPDWQSGQRVNVSDIAGTFETEQQAREVLEHCETTNLALRYVLKARMSSLSQLIDREAHRKVESSDR